MLPFPLLSAFLRIALAVTGAITILVFAMPNLVVLGYFLLILPGLILAITPTVFLYLSVFSIAWFVLRSKGSFLAIAAGLAAIAFVSVGIPTLFNLQTAEWYRAAAATNRDAPALLKPVDTIAINQPLSYWTESTCNDLCQLLLYNGTANHVLVPLPAGFKPKPRGLQPTPRLFSIRHQSNCVSSDNSRDALKYISDRWTHNAREIAKAVRFRIATGDCLVSEATANTQSDLVIRLIDEVTGKKESNLALLPGSVRSQGLEIIAGGSLIARETARQADFLSLPLHVVPYGGLEIQAWKWSRQTTQDGSSDAVLLLKKFTTFDLNTPRGADLAGIRRIIDEALEDPTAPDGAFLLLEDYYELLRREAPEMQDWRRITRLIADNRVTNFTYLSNVAPLPSYLRDPILDRLLRLGKSPAEQSTFRGLEAIAAKLPPGTYREAVPALDTLLSDPARRARSLNLLGRLADRGPAGAAPLAAIAFSPWQPPGKLSGRVWANDAAAALEALCRLGTEASSVLPEMRRYSSDFPDGAVIQGDSWRKTMVALGADASGFTSKSSYYKTPAQYQQHLENLARRCATPSR